MAKVYLGNTEISAAVVNASLPVVTDISEANYLVRTDGTVELLKKTDNTILPLFEKEVAGTWENRYNYEGDSTIMVVNCNSLETIDGSAFTQTFTACTNLTSVSFNNLINAGSYCFSDSFPWCNNLKSVDFPNLKSIGYDGMGGLLDGCTSIETVSFPALDSIDSWGFTCAFAGATSIKDVYFNSLKTNSFLDVDAFDDILLESGTDVVHTLHFPSNLQPTIAQLEGYPLFGGDSGYVVLAFDLPATE